MVTPVPGGGDAPRIFDCFPFFCELDLLELRLRELAPVVHRFVLVEADWDFNGNPKPLHYHENRDRFAEWADRIDHVVVRDRPANEGERWALQRFQRDQILRALDDAAPGDVIAISDLDEIPDTAVFTATAARLSRAAEVAVLMMHQHEYRLDLRRDGPLRACARMVARRHLKVPHLVRQMKARYWKGYPDSLDQIPARFNAMAACGWPARRVVVPEAGWHLSFMGDAEFVGQKLSAYSQDENIAANRLPRNGFVRAAEHLDRATGAQVPDGFHRVPLGDLPGTVVAEPERFRHLLLPAA